MAHDVFISYSTKDKNIADAVCRNLERNGIRCFYAPRDIVPGKKWQGEIVKAIRQSKICLLIFTRFSNASEHVLNEITNAFSAHRTIIPFIVSKTQMGNDLSYCLKGIHRLDAVTPPLIGHIQELYEAICGHLEIPGNCFTPVESEDGDLSAGPGSGFRLRNGGLPDRTVHCFDSFEGLKDRDGHFTSDCIHEIPEYYMDPVRELRQIENIFDSDSCVVLTGIDGIGKTTLAARFIQGIGQMSIYFKCTSDADFHQYAWMLLGRGAFEARAVEQDFQEALKDIRLLAEGTGSILLFDDVRDDETFLAIHRHFISQGVPCVLTTSRQDMKQFHLDRVCVAVSSLEDQEAAVLLDCRNEEERQAAAKLNRFCCGIPLALVEARTYMDVKSVSVAGYLQLLEEERAGKLISSDPRESLLHTVWLAWKGIRDDGMRGSGGAIDILKWCSVLNASCISEEDLRSLSKRRPADFDRDFASILKYSLVTRKNGRIHIAGIVQWAIRSIAAREKNLYDLYARLGRWIGLRWKERVRTEYRFYSDPRLFRHAQNLINLLEQYTEEEIEEQEIEAYLHTSLLCTLHQMTGEYAFYTGDFPLAEKEFAYITDVRNPDPDVRMLNRLSRAMLAEAKRERDKAWAALKEAKRLFQDREKIYPIRYILCIQTEAHLYDDDLDYERAERTAFYALSLLEKWRDITERNHVELEMELKNILAHVYAGTKRYAEALGTYRYIKERLASEFGEEKARDIPAYLYACANEAYDRTLLASGEDEVLRREVMETSIRSLYDVLDMYRTIYVGNKHQDIIMIYANLAAAHLSNQDYSHCVECCEEAQRMAFELRLLSHHTLIETEWMKVEARLCISPLDPLDMLIECHKGLQMMETYRQEGGREILPFDHHYLMLLYLSLSAFSLAAGTEEVEIRKEAEEALGKAKEILCVLPKDCDNRLNYEQTIERLAQRLYKL